MREHSLHPIGTAVWAAYAFRLYICVFCLCVASVASSRAQTLPLSHGERVDYELYFKWGFIMSKAGLATLSVKESEYQGAPSWHYSLLFRSAGVIEKVFRMRDTMDCHYSKEPRLLFSSKRTNEGDYYLVDDLRFAYQENDRVEIHSLRHTLRETKIDTMLMAKGLVFDMLGATMYLRSLDWQTMSYGAESPFKIAIGRDLVNARFRYTGQQIVERKGAKFRTRHFYVDIYDEAFSQAKEAAEVWIGDDENHIPVKIRAKLKIGAAEVYYKDSYNLRAPLACRIVVQGTR
ncbi:DUF3108 domain-containing protein [Parabacteroides sp. ZJ-118]|uniref:DUF3108 domain-containing protein n=1 Tax=Parabacteroides sp. ZJ-118 TaxID=2709398 RepID=UPI0013ED9F82|nr:DUF3108 domain-containing protein [Parabacteroides sp. ZJ-118]